MGNRGGDQEAEEAIREIGSNAVPILLAKLQASNPEWKAWLRNSRAGERLPLKWLLGAEYNWWEAELGFQILGTQAVSAIPGLQAMMTNSKTMDRSLMALGRVGPPALPALRAASTNRDPAIRALAPWSLTVRKDVARLAVSDLTRLFNDTNDMVSNTAFRALLRTLPRTEATNLLMAALEHPRKARQLLALNSLSNLGANQTMAVPVLVRLLQHTNQEVVFRAARELARIDPATASKNGVDANILRDPRRPVRGAGTNSPP